MKQAKNHQQRNLRFKSIKNHLRTRSSCRKYKTLTRIVAKKVEFGYQWVIKINQKYFIKTFYQIIICYSDNVYIYF